MRIDIPKVSDNVSFAVIADEFDIYRQRQVVEIEVTVTLPGGERFRNRAVIPHSALIPGGVVMERLLEETAYGVGRKVVFG